MSQKLFVGNLSFNTSDGDLMELFSTKGTCESASVVTDRISGRSRGFGFVEMSTADEAQRAISELDGSDLQGRNINVREARDRAAGRPGHGPRGPRGFGNRQGPPEGFRPAKNRGSRRGLRGKRRSL